jgi:type II secretory pathway pseudopilin PulG
MWPTSTTRRRADRVRSWRRHEAGLTLVELLVSLVVLASVTTGTLLMWQRAHIRAVSTSVARLTKLYIHQARMRAIHDGVNHFVVLDPENKRLEIHADVGTTAGSFDDDDELVASTELSDVVALTLPTEPDPLTSPLDATNVTQAWSLPAPDTSARWGPDLRGVMATPRGLIASAEASPTTISTGVIVFSTRDDVTSAVGIRGLEGSVRSYELLAGAWKEL